MTNGSARRRAATTTASEINAVLRPLLASQPFAHWSDRLAAERIMHEQLNSYTGFLEQPHVDHAVRSRGWIIRMCRNPCRCRR